MATSAFYTFDPMKIDAEKLIQPILKSIEGKHEELLAKKGDYFKLVTMQTLQ